MKFVLFPLLFLGMISFMAPFSFSSDKTTTKMIVRVVSKDAKVIGSGVGGALVRIKNVETGEILAEGNQEGGTGDTDRIMVVPRRRGETVYGTPDAALFHAEIPLSKPTRVEIYAEAPLGYPQAIQKAARTMMLVPGKDLLGEGVVIELSGLIVSITEPVSTIDLLGRKKINVKAQVRML